MTLLIVDGMDRCGKDTLIRALVRGRRVMKPLHVLHNVAPPATLSGGQARQYHMDLYLAQLQLASEWDAQDFVINRAFASEAVYGRLYRGQPEELPAEWMADASLALRSVPHLHVTLTGDPQQVLLRNDGDSTFDKGTSNRLELAAEERRLFVQHHRGLARWDVQRAAYDETPPAKVVEDVAALLGW